MSNLLNVLSDDDEPWYKTGLEFQCTECGGCCTGAPGYVWVSDNEIEQMAAFLDLSTEEFSKRYLRFVNDRMSLKETHPHYDCVFLKDKKCTIYSVRPKQCRTFPWWPQNLKSKQDWEEAAKHCEGIRKQAAKVPFNAIEEQLAIHLKSDE